MRFGEINIQLPGWIDGALPDRNTVFKTDEQKMELVLKLTRRNIHNFTGGPFGAAVFDSKTNRLIAPGVNIVIPSNCCVTHAEIVAICLAQQTLGTHDLSADGRRCELFASTEPCTMCLGAVCWSGLRRLVCAARDADATAIGFDEGPKPPHWAEELQNRGISVTRDILRKQSRTILNEYATSGGNIYNPNNNGRTK